MPWSSFAGKTQGPRVGNAGRLMAMGLAGSLDDAFSEATSDLASWLQEDYKLARSETAILLGAAIRYQIAEVADRNAGVVANRRPPFHPLRRPRRRRPRPEATDLSRYPGRIG
jgi:hypothetical protein